jgi:hypothetical protein
MRAILISKRFNPGHVSHIVANCKLLEAQGFQVIYSLNDNFFEFSRSEFKGREASLSDYLNLSSGDLCVLWFPSLTAIFELIVVRLLSLTTIVYVYHEPYTSFASYRAAGFSRFKAIKVTGISLVNRILCGLSHKIILPSERAYNALPAARGNPERFAKLNLLFSDEAQPEQITKKRSFISYIGTIAEDHAFEEFVNLMHTSISNERLFPHKFLIATRSKIPERLSLLVEYGIKSGRLLVQSGTPMSNEMINNFYSKSYVVWNAYKRSMQSGVLPKAYMFGTPVLMSESNKSEYFQEGVHGILISDRYGFDEFENGILKMQKNWGIISGSCRNFYLQNFDYRALQEPYMKFLMGRQ